MPKKSKQEKGQLKVVDGEEPLLPVMRLGDNTPLEHHPVRIAVPEMKVEGVPRLEEHEATPVSKRRSEPEIEAPLEQPKAEESIEDHWAEKPQRRKLPVGWIVLSLSGVAVLVATAALLFSYASQLEEIEGARQASVEHLETQEQKDLEAEVLVDAMDAGLREYLEAQSVEALLPHVRDPLRVEPLMRSWYAEHPFEARDYSRLKVFHPLDIKGRLFWLVTCELKDDRGDEVLLVEQTQDDQIRVDWESQICFQPMPWDEYVAERPEAEAMDFRVYVRPDFGGLFSHEFRDEEKWVGYKLTAKNSDEFLIGYVERESELAETLLQIARDARGRQAPLLLRLRVPPGVQSKRGVLIEEILSERWAVISTLN